MIYFVDDLRSLLRPTVQVEANSPLEAAKKAFPDKKVVRDTSNTGNVIVGGDIQTRYGKGYRRYCYKFEL